MMMKNNGAHKNVPNVLFVPRRFKITFAYSRENHYDKGMFAVDSWGKGKRASSIGPLFMNFS